MAELPAAYLAYLAKRDAQRADAITATLGCLSERELRLVREAAVMGYVRGRMHLEGEPHPKDTAVLAEVIDACLAAPDLYPVISGVRPCTECDHPEYGHREGDDPVSPGSCLACGPDGEPHDFEAAS